MPVDSPMNAASSPNRPDAVRPQRRPSVSISLQTSRSTRTPTVESAPTTPTRSFAELDDTDAFCSDTQTPRSREDGSIKRRASAPAMRTAFAPQPMPPGGWPSAAVAVDDAQPAAPKPARSEDDARGLPGQPALFAQLRQAASAAWRGATAPLQHVWGALRGAGDDIQARCARFLAQHVAGATSERLYDVQAQFSRTFAQETDKLQRSARSAWGSLVLSAGQLAMVALSAGLHALSLLSAYVIEGVQAIAAEVRRGFADGSRMASEGMDALRARLSAWMR